MINWRMDRTISSYEYPDRLFSCFLLAARVQSYFVELKDWVVFYSVRYFRFVSALYSNRVRCSVIANSFSLFPSLFA